MKKSYLALLLMVGAVALTVNAAFAMPGNEDNIGSKLMNAKISQMMRSRAANLGVSAIDDTVYIGFNSAFIGPNNYWGVAAGNGQPPAKPRPSQPGPGGPQTGTDGMWSFETPVHGDSLQGWWPIRQFHLNSSGATLTDDKRPWWAIEMGNQANYVINERRDGSGTSPGDRTFGVVGVWHVDDGGAPVNDPNEGDVNPSAPAFVGGKGWATGPVAWMGLRGHGDVRYKDAVTGNAFNQDVLDYNGFTGSNPINGNGTSKHFPGYGNQMDQMLYRDIDVSGLSSSLSIAFDVATQMDIETDSGVKTRTGWFEGDTKDVDQTLTGLNANFISAEAGPPSLPANGLAPVDSFQVYVGEPVGNGTSADKGLAFTDSYGATDNVYDPARRWFNEVLKKSNRRWLFSVCNSTPKTNQVLTLSQADAQALAGAGGKLRLVFRVHTNRGFDDENVVVSASTSYNSAYMGAAQIDNVTLTGTGLAANGGWGTGNADGTFTNTTDIDNSGSTSALKAWKATGKPPATKFHIHSLSSIFAGGGWQDLCGPPNAATSICNMFGQVISMGNHDDDDALAQTKAQGDGVHEVTEHNGHFGIISPTIQLAAPGVGTNPDNLTLSEATATEDYYFDYEIYTGNFNVFSTGSLWRFGFQDYPVKQSDNERCWDMIRLPGFNYFNPDPQCFNSLDAMKANGCLATSNGSGVPDSVRVYIMLVQQCYRFGIGDAACHATITSGGTGLLDNMSFVLIDGAAQAMSLDIWQPYTDAFPVNIDPSFPGNPAKFDTAAAYLKSGINVAQTTGNTLRPDVGGDSMVVNANGQGDNIRVDLVFRIKPGPGNYVTAGNTASGLRKVPNAAPAAAPGDGSFFGTYLSNSGPFCGSAAPNLNVFTYGGSGEVTSGSNANMGASWDPLFWCSARCDTAKIQIFPNLSTGIDPSAGFSAAWSSTYHEADSADANSAAHKALRKNINRCWVIDTTSASLFETNVSCSGTHPVWVNTYLLNPAKIGWNGSETTTEGTKILPDGIFTAGTHVEYFFQRTDLTGLNAGKHDYVPDPTTVVPQPLEGSFDAHRWQEFSILPDRWKDGLYGGAGQACMLYLDWNDRRGDENVWVDVADSIGATAVSKRGAHNGWSAPGVGTVSQRDPNNAANWVNKNDQPGTTWDMYGIKASESLNTSSNPVGARKSTAGSGTLTGKDCNTAPTPTMLETYYKVILLLSGDLNSAILGPFKDRSADDVFTLDHFLKAGTGPAQKGLYAGGNGFAEDAFNAGGSQHSFLTDDMGADLHVAIDPSADPTTGYRTLSGNSATVADIIAQPAIVKTFNNGIYGVRNGCTFTLDVLKASTGVQTSATVGAYYQNVGIYGPYPANIANPGNGTWITDVDGWDIFVLTGRFDVSTNGRLAWYFQAFANLFAATGCTVQGTPAVPLDVPNVGNGSQLVDFVGNFSNNPLRSGSAVVKFGLASTDRVEVDVFDVSGRLVRKLADRIFPAGEHTLTWDGVNDQGQVVARGVYFTQVKFVNRRFADARKLTVLK